MLRLVNIFGYLSVLLRAGILVFQSLLLGGVIFRFWIVQPGPDLTAGKLEGMQSSATCLLRAAAIGMALIQALYLYANAAVLMASADLSFREVIGANFFIAGSVGFVAAVLFAACTNWRGRFSVFSQALLVAVILTTSAITNHAAARMDNRALLLTMSVLHEVATGFWVGGLPFLLLGLIVAGDDGARWHISGRFSRLALFSVAVLGLSGVGMSLYYIGSVHALYGTAYGVMVSAKAAMLGLLLLLGGINFFLLRKYGTQEALPRLRRLVEAEIGIGITIVLSAASLTSQPPAADMTGQTVDLPRIVARLTPHWPRLQSPQVAELSTTFPGESFSSPAAPPLPAAYTADGVPLSAGDLADMQWSEFNHHWMGVLVLAMGLLALLARSGRFKWAEYWPLLLMGIALFIFLRADPETWPLGPQGFWESWVKPEVFQHRVAALLCIGFAIFELHVRRRGSQGGPLSLMFPILCAAGGALLLTHSHSVTNVQEELLAEMSHVPLGILAVLAGWSRWLEIRLPETDRSIPAWIWPVCFVLIGAGLLNYREF
jgi:putative copper resistance protein D